MKAGRTERKSRWIRSVVQVAMLLFVLSIVAGHYLSERGFEPPWGTPSLHAVCPFGAVESVGRLIFQQKLLPKIHASSFWVLLGSAGMTLIFGALFCGWLCPLGSVQDWIGHLGKRLLGKRYNRIVPPRIDRLLGYLRYAVLGIVLVESTRLVNLVFSAYDPYYALFHFWTGEALASAIAVLAVVLAGSLFAARPWCRWLCPFGAVQGILQLASPWKIRRDAEACTACRMCSRACPMRIEIADKSAVSDTRCNRCGECIAACPVRGALEYRLAGGKRLSLGHSVLPAVLALTLFAAPIVFARWAGLFRTSNGIEVAEGLLEPDDITSSTTIEELASGLGISISETRRLLHLPEDAGKAIKMRDLEDLEDGLTTPVVRARVAEILGSPR